MSEGNGYLGIKSNHTPRIGERIRFGTQNGKKFEWKVLDVQDNKALPSIIVETIVRLMVNVHASKSMASHLSPKTSPRRNP